MADSVRVTVWAPLARSLDAVLPAHEGRPEARRPLAPVEGGHWTIDLQAGTDYLLSVDGGEPRPDPRSARQPYGVNGPSRAFDAATFAYTSTAMPMLTGTLITAAGFLPIGLAKSAAGEYTFSMFSVNAIALIVSWLVAVVFTPYIGYLILKVKPHAPGEDGHDERGERPAGDDLEDDVGHGVGGGVDVADAGGAERARQHRHPDGAHGPRGDGDERDRPGRPEQQPRCGPHGRRPARSTQRSGGTASMTRLYDTTSLTAVSATSAASAVPRRAGARWSTARPSSAPRPLAPASPSIVRSRRSSGSRPAAAPSGAASTVNPGAGKAASAVA